MKRRQSLHRFLNAGGTAGKEDPVPEYSKCVPGRFFITKISGTVRCTDIKCMHQLGRRNKYDGICMKASKQKKHLELHRS